MRWHHLHAIAPSLTDAVSETGSQYVSLSACSVSDHVVYEVGSMAEPTSIVLTGGLGFLGRAIVKAVQEAYPACHIIILDRALDERGIESRQKVEVRHVDITSAADVSQAFSHIQADTVIHTAGYSPLLNVRYSRSQEELTRKVNIDGTRNVLNAAKEAQCKAFVYTSSCCAVTDDLTGYYANIDETFPVSRKSLPYGESKVEAEELVLAANDSTFATCCLRPAVIFGEEDYQLIPSIYACIAKGEALFRLGDGQNLWDVVYVGNVADAHVLAAKNLLSSQSAVGETFFIQNNEPVTFRELCLAVWKQFEYYPPFEIYIPQSLAWIVGLISEYWTWISGFPTTISRGSILDACAVRYANGDKAERILGFTPRIGLEEGIRRSCQVSALRRGTRSR